MDTLYRYKYLLNFGIKVELLCDNLYYIDVDVLIVNYIKEEILPDNKYLVGTLHPGFAYSDNKNGSLEKNIKSKAYVDPEKYKNYYLAGGFNGGLTSYFLKMADELEKNINIDKSQNILSVWHDESHFNSYFLNNFDKFKILSTDYCYPQNYHETIPGEAKILVLSKEHNKVRNIFLKNKIFVDLKGRLGNILFQIFVAYTIAKRYNLILCINKNSTYKYNLFDNILNVENFNLNNDFIEINEKEFKYNEIINNLPMSKNILLSGYFQSTKYFSEYFDIIKKELNFKTKEIANIIIKNYKLQNLNKILIGIHIRGTDYLNLSKYHTNLTKKYYEKCLKKIINVKEKNIILFTDDINYSNEKFSDIYNINIKDIINDIIPKEYEYLKNNDELDLFLLSELEYIICANSTFSLWSSYFSNAKTVFIPKNWFGVEGPEYEINDFCLNDNYVIIN